MGFKPDELATIGKLKTNHPIVMRYENEELLYRAINVGCGIYYSAIFEYFKMDVGACCTAGITDQGYNLRLFNNLTHLNQ